MYKQTAFGITVRHQAGRAFLSVCRSQLTTPTSDSCTLQHTCLYRLFPFLRYKPIRKTEDKTDYHCQVYRWGWSNNRPSVSKKANCYAPIEMTQVSYQKKSRTFCLHSRMQFFSCKNGEKLLKNPQTKNDVVDCK